MLSFAFTMTLLVCAAAGVGLWIQFVLSIRPGQVIVPVGPHPSPFGLVDVVLFFLAWVFTSSLAATALVLFWGHENFSDLSAVQVNWLMCATAVVQLISCVVVTLVLLKKYGSADRVFGLRLDMLGEHAITSGKTFLMVVPAIWSVQALLAMLVPYEHATLSQLQENFSGMTLVATWLSAVFVAPVCEELFFRGVFLGWLQRVEFGHGGRSGFAEITGGWNDVSNEEPPGPKAMNEDRPVPVPKAMLRQGRTMVWWLPVLISAVLFAAIHWGQGLAPITLFFFGLALGVLRLKTRSVVPAILLHFMLNAFSMFWMTLRMLAT